MQLKLQLCIALMAKEQLIVVPFTRESCRLESSQAFKTN